MAHSNIKGNVQPPAPKGGVQPPGRTLLSLDDGGEARARALHPSPTSRRLLSADPPPANAAKSMEGAAADAEPKCADWAKEGECEKNPGFMIFRCQTSCAPRAGGAACAAWKTDGRCDDQRTFMDAFCKGVCGDGGAGALAEAAPKTADDELKDAARATAEAAAAAAAGDGGAGADLDADFVYTPSGAYDENALDVDEAGFEALVHSKARATTTIAITAATVPTVRSRISCARARNEMSGGGPRPPLLHDLIQSYFAIK